MPIRRVYERGEVLSRLRGFTRQYARGLTTPLGTLIKIKAGGIPVMNFDMPTARKLYAALDCYARDADGTFLKDMDPLEAGLEIDKLLKISALCKRAFASVSAEW